MHRSASSTRVSDEYYTTAGQAAGTRSAADTDHLPLYGAHLEITKKETRLSFAENAVHLIPVIIIICATVIWLFSNPQLEIASKDDSILSRIRNMTIDGYSIWNGTSVSIGMEDLGPKNEIGRDAETKIHVKS